MDIDIQHRVESLSSELEQGTSGYPIRSGRENNPYELQYVILFRWGLQRWMTRDSALYGIMSCLWPGLRMESKIQPHWPTSWCDTMQEQFFSTWRLARWSNTCRHHALARVSGETLCRSTSHFDWTLWLDTAQWLACSIGLSTFFCQGITLVFSQNWEAWDYRGTRRGKGAISPLWCFSFDGPLNICRLVLNSSFWRR